MISSMGVMLVVWIVALIMMAVPVVGLPSVWSIDLRISSPSLMSVGFR